MTAPALRSWDEANKDALAAEIAAVREQVSAWMGEGEAPAAPPREDGTALSRVCAVFGLSSFERSLLVLCAGAEMDGDLARLCGRANGDPRQTEPTFSLALAALPDAHWSALVPASPLRHWRLLRVEESGSLTTSLLRIDERVLHYLLGMTYLPPALEGRLRPLGAERLPETYQASLGHTVSALRVSDLVQLRGEPRRGGRLVAAHAAHALGLMPWLMQASSAPTELTDRLEFARLMEREATLADALLVVELEPRQRPPQALVSLLDELDCGVLLLGEQPLTMSARPPLQVEVPRLGIASQVELWRQALPPVPAPEFERVAASVSRFDLTPEAIADIAAAAGDSAGDALLGRLYEACRDQARPALEGLAERVSAAAGWDDLVLPERPMALLKQIAAQLQHQYTVHHRWGFANGRRVGLGVSALFSGPSGTGKTLAAEVLAAELHLDLYRIDLSAVVSKYIGETEKNLRAVFDAAETGGAVLLFDEADALFGKRSEVKDSHDRYANIEVGYLLQRMEAYTGLAILTSNLKSNLDDAFLRRLRFVVEFPFPEVAQRAAMWARAFPAGVPRDGLDPARLAQLQITGGSIRNIALNAAFQAAEDRTAVSLRHVRGAALVEFAKLERIPNRSDFVGWPR